MKPFWPAWQSAATAANRIERQYQAVDPENRLVAHTLEARWEESLQNSRHAQEEYDRFLSQTPASLSEADRSKIQRLSGDIPALWRTSQTMAADRKEVLRCLVERVVVHVQPDSEHVDVAIHWQGGFTELKRLRKLSKYCNSWALRDRPELTTPGPRSIKK